MHYRNAGLKLFAAGFVIASSLAAFGQTQSDNKSSIRVKLGLKLFNDDRFSSSQGDLQNSCRSCHLSDEDPQGMRAHTDFFARSWVTGATAVLKIALGGRKAVIIE